MALTLHFDLGECPAGMSILHENHELAMLGCEICCM